MPVSSEAVKDIPEALLEWVYRGAWFDMALDVLGGAGGGAPFAAVCCRLTISRCAGSSSAASGMGSDSCKTSGSGTSAMLRCFAHSFVR
jgi:hypothetical protein